MSVDEPIYATVNRTPRQTLGPKNFYQFNHSAIIRTLLISIDGDLYILDRLMSRSIKTSMGISDVTQIFQCTNKYHNIIATKSSLLFCVENFDSNPRFKFINITDDVNKLRHCCVINDRYLFVFYDEMYLVREIDSDRLTPTRQITSYHGAATFNKVIHSETLDIIIVLNDGSAYTISNDRLVKTEDVDLNLDIRGDVILTSDGDFSVAIDDEQNFLYVSGGVSKGFATHGNIMKYVYYLSNNNLHYHGMYNTIRNVSHTSLMNPITDVDNIHLSGPELYCVKGGELYYVHHNRGLELVASGHIILPNKSNFDSVMYRNRTNTKRAS